MVLTLHCTEFSFFLGMSYVYKSTARNDRPHFLFYIIANDHTGSSARRLSHTSRVQIASQKLHVHWRCWKGVKSYNSLAFCIDAKKRGGKKRHGKKRDGTSLRLRKVQLDRQITTSMTSDAWYDAIGLNASFRANMTDISKTIGQAVEGARQMRRVITPHSTCARRPLPKEQGLFGTSSSTKR